VLSCAEEREQMAKLAKVDHQVAEKRAEEAQIEAQIAKVDAALPEGDLPLPQPLKGAIVLSKTPGIWRMSADP
jgi:hypothetical protein